MSEEWPVTTCCKEPIRPRAKFCTKCGWPLSSNDRDVAATLREPEPPPSTPAVCEGCEAALSPAELLEPVYSFISGLREADDDRRSRPPQPDPHAGKTFLGPTGNLVAYMWGNNLGPLARAALYTDPTLAAYARVEQIAAVVAVPRGGYSGPRLAVRDCPHCGRPDPAGLVRDLQAGLDAIRRLP